MLDLATKLPRLEYLGCNHFVGSGWTPYYNSEAARTYSRDCDRPGPLRDTRVAFAEALEQATLSSTLREARLDFLWPMPSAERIDHDEQIPNLAGSNAYDLFSSSLRSLTHGLRRLNSSWSLMRACSGPLAVLHPIRT